MDPRGRDLDPRGRGLDPRGRGLDPRGRGRDFWPRGQASRPNIPACIVGTVPSSAGWDKLFYI